MKFSIIGDIPPQDKESYITRIDVFIKDHAVGPTTILATGDLTTLKEMDRYAKNKGYDCIILGNAIQLGVFNASKVILVWDGKDKRYEHIIPMCQKERVSYTEVRTK